MSGQPAISLPVHRNVEGHPIGIRLAAANGRDDILIHVASQLESANPWSPVRPVIP
jgi:amidase